MAKNLITPGLVIKGKTPGKYHDKQGAGLFLLIRKDGGKQWKQRVTINGRRRELGLGNPPTISLADARRKAMENKKAALDGVDIIAERRREKQAATFEELARQRHKDLGPTWRNKKHGAQWLSTMETYVFPKIGKLHVGAVTPMDIKEILMQPIKKGEGVFWHDKAETARRVRQRMGDVFKFAMAAGLRTDDPVMMIAAALPKQKKKVIPHRSLPYDQVAEAITTIKAGECNIETELAFEWLVLTATRSSETRLARWGEIDMAERLWTIPAERMKADREHRIPLPDRCIEILLELAGIDHEGADITPDTDLGFDPERLIFPSLDIDKPLSDATFNKLMRENNINAVTHGFRSSFRVWVQEQTNVPNAVAEAALAHSNPNKTEAAYARSDYLDKRRALMQDWADFLGGGA